MDASIKTITGFPVSILSALIVTASLFMLLPLLTKIPVTSNTPQKTESIFLDLEKPTPPPPDDRNDPKKQTMPEKEMIEKIDPIQRSKPKFDISRGNSIASMGSDIEIEITPTFDPKTTMLNPTFLPNEVDQSPRLLRSVSPHYPYLARQDNVEGWVVLQFVVDKDGNTEKAKVVAADPEGIFDEAALRTVEHYKFKPAMNKGVAVNCLMKQRIQFRLD
jgi:protein TonB